MKMLKISPLQLVKIKELEFKKGTTTKKQAGLSRATL
jgi:hypothetical protein